MTDVYLYAAALLCADCGEAQRADLRASGDAPEDEDDESSYDSDDFPTRTKRRLRHDARGLLVHDSRGVYRDS